ASDRKINVLRIITTIEPAVGGPSYSAVNAAAAEQGPDLRTTLVSTCEPRASEATPSALTEAGVTHLAFPRVLSSWGPASRWGLSPRFLAWIVRHGWKHDIIHVHYVWSLGTLFGVLVGAVSRTPVVMTPHESLTEFDIEFSRSRLRTMQKRVVKRLLLSGIRRIVVASELERRDSRLASHAAVVVPHPVPRAAAPDQSRATRGGGTVVGFLGRLHPKKRLDVLLDALAKTDSPTTLLVGGDQPRSELRRLQSLVASEGLADRVTFLGFVASAQRDSFFARIDLLAMPSTYECFGMVAAEAMSAGVPVVVTRSTGVAEIVERHKAGVVIETPDADTLAAAIERLTDDGVRKPLGERASGAARDEFSFQAYRRDISALYASLVSGR
ncbi:MAG: glycosyltransferase family 4 protein, partial [Patulibacter sp.]